MKRFIKPVEGKRPCDRLGNAVPEQGATVEWSSWWDRRLREGAIEVSDAPADTPRRAKKTKGSTDNDEEQG